MYTKTLILMTAAASGVMSAELNLFPGHVVIKRELVPRETATAALEPCISSLLAVGSSLPTPAPDLIAALATQTDICSISLTGSLSDKFNTFTNSVATWYSSNSGVINSALSQCPQYASMASAEIPLCLKTAGKLGGASASASGVASAAATPTGGLLTATGSPPAVATGGVSAATTGFTNGTIPSIGGGGGGNGPVGPVPNVTAITTAARTGGAAAVRETGLVAGAIAAAGFLGAVAAL